MDDLLRSDADAFFLFGESKFVLKLIRKNETLFILIYEVRVFGNNKVNLKPNSFYARCMLIFYYAWR